MPNVIQFIFVVKFIRDDRFFCAFTPNQNQMLTATNVLYRQNNKSVLELTIHCNEMTIFQP